MIHRIWLFEDWDGNYEAFLHIEEARDFAYKKLIDWGYDIEEDASIFKELKDSYENERYSGFWVDELFWCNEITYHC